MNIEPLPKSSADPQIKFKCSLFFFVIASLPTTSYILTFTLQVPDCDPDAPILFRYGDDVERHSYRLWLSNVDAVGSRCLHGLIPSTLWKVRKKQDSILQHLSILYAHAAPYIRDTLIFRYFYNEYTCKRWQGAKQVDSSNGRHSSSNGNGFAKKVRWNRRVRSKRESLQTTTWSLWWE